MSMEPKNTCKPSKKLSPTMTTVVPPAVGPSLGHMALITGVDNAPDDEEDDDEDDEDEHDNDDELAAPDAPPTPAAAAAAASDGSMRRLRRPCFELLCTNMLSDMASSGPSTLICCDMTT